MKTDLNERERQRFTSEMRALGKSAIAIADAIEDGDDTKALAHLALVAISGQTVNELMKIFTDALKLSREDGVYDELESIADRINNKGE